MNMWNELTTDFFLSEKARALFTLYSNKEVPFRFRGTSFSFNLSQSLFSGFDVDAGSRFLLKSISQAIDLKTVDSILDIGSGAGILGISLLKQSTEKSFLTMQDRNSWALLFSAQNAIKNGIEPSRFRCQSLLMLEKSLTPQDLIVSNIPAKAGNSVIEQFLQKAPFHTSEKGVVAIVIVKPLAQLAKKAVEAAGHSILFQEENNDYLVLHYQNPQKEGDSSTPNSKAVSTISLDLYCRAEAPFKLNEIAYRLKTVYNIPDFDQIGYHWRQLADLIETIPLPQPHSPLQTVLVNPGQGHLALYCQALFAQKKQAAVFHLISHDRLELQSVKANLPESTNEKRFQFWLGVELPEIEADLIFINPTFLTLPHEIKHLCNSIERKTKRGAFLAISARSSDLLRYQKELKSFSLIRNKKGRGFKGLLLKKN